MNLSYIKIIVPFTLLMLAATNASAGQPKGAEIPWTQIPADKSAVVHEVLNSHTLYREMEDSLPLCSPETFEYMIDRLRVTNIVIRQVSPKMEHWLITNLGEDRYFIDDQVRTRGTVELLYKTPDFRLYLAKGRWRYWGDHYFGGTIVISLFYQQAAQDPQKPLQTKIRAYIKLESLVISTLTKAVDVIIPILVDRRVALMSFTMRAAGEKMCREPHYVYELLLKEPDISEAERKEYQTTFLYSKK